MSFIAITLLLLSNPSFAAEEKLVPTTAQECSSIDLRNEYLGPARDQGEVAWCYAFASSDLLAYRFKQTVRPSAADVAVGHNEGTIPTILKRVFNLFTRKKNPDAWKMQHQTGFSKIALQRSLKAGSCPESVFPSEKWVKRGPAGERDIVPLKTAMLDIADLKAQTQKGLRFEDMPYWYELQNVDAQSFYDTVKRYHRLEIFDRLRYLACNDSRQEYAERPHATMKFKIGKIFRHVDRELEQENPVLIDYDSDILDDHTTRSFNLDDLHTSVVVGRRWNNNACEYLIRDSYGTGCGDKYDPVYQCEAGHVWIPQSYLYRVMTSVVYLEGP